MSVLPLVIFVVAAVVCVILALVLGGSESRTRTDSLLSSSVNTAVPDALNGVPTGDAIATGLMS